MGKMSAATRIVSMEDDGGGSKCLVPYDHPVTVLFNEARRAQGAPDISELDFIPGACMYVAYSSDVDLCINELRNVANVKKMSQ